MRRALEVPLFAGLALGLHLAAFAMLGDSAGAVAAGAGGAAAVSIEAADAGLVALVAQWDRPPLALPAPELALPPQTPPQIASPAPPPPAPVAAPPRLPTPGIALPAPPDAPPDAPVAASPPPREARKPEPKPDPKPETVKPNPKTAPAAVSQPAQRATGSGGGASAGQAGRATAGTLSPAQANAAKASWGAAIRAKVERRKSYPPAAGRASGRVLLSLSVSRTGALQSVSVATSSGHPALDAAALRAVRAAGRFAAAPKGLDAASYSFTLPISFSR